MDVKNARANEKRSGRRRKKSFTEALKEKYCVEDEPTFDFIIISPKRKSNSTAELAHLQTVVLNEMDVTRADIPCQGLTSLCPNVVDLDLANNLLDKWTELLTILSHLPKVKYVNVSRNNLRLHPSDPLPEAKLSVENLALNDTGVSIEEIVKLSPILPMLKELHLCGNNYEELADIEERIQEGAFSTLECLRLNNNGISSWSEVWKLRHLPNLKYLVLSGNPVKDIFYQVCSQNEQLDLASSIRSDTSQSNSMQDQTNTNETNEQTTDLIREWDSSDPSFSDSNLFTYPSEDLDAVDEIEDLNDLDTESSSEDIEDCGCTHRPVSRFENHSDSDCSDGDRARTDSESDVSLSAEDNFCFSELDASSNSNFNNSYVCETHMPVYSEFEACPHNFSKSVDMSRDSESKCEFKLHDEDSEVESSDSHRLAAETFLFDVINNIDFSKDFPPVQSPACAKSGSLHTTTPSSASHENSLSPVKLADSVSHSANSDKQTSVIDNMWLDDILEKEMFINIHFEQNDGDLFTPRSISLQDEDFFSHNHSNKSYPAKTKTQRCLFQEPDNTTKTELSQENDSSLKNESSSLAHQITPTQTCIQSHSSSSKKSSAMLPERPADSCDRGEGPQHSQHRLHMAADVSESEKTQPFHQLQTLCLSNANLSHWTHLKPFKLFPKLNNIRLKNNPLYSSEHAEDRRKLYIASLPTVNVLNGSEISQTEREKAERHYLRYYMDQEEKPEFYYTLIKKHGPPVRLVDIDLSAGYQEWANLKFVCEGVVKFTRKIHLVEPITRLRAIISQELKIPKSCFLLYHHSCGPSHPESERELVELRCESLPMSRFDFAEGDEVHIDIRD
ncbi:uncharacterized protein LOC131929880 isoform X2 [Physella acuta]|uniref:uncharacterized protein LOC131929880 isoform X1 n=1 Tax=Physella acuta TaxID=109671 RepID=UPI0027DBDFAD|nr:uncharacterized protein LOC131929880 isoform X1 [Physella acuta]XP_059142238.1 uncharacterized protein LOC131929880 isoform X2 [Physella acuta]